MSTNCFHGLVVMTINIEALAASDLRKPAAFEQAYTVRTPVTRLPLLVFDGFRSFARNVLNQGPTSRNIPYLQTKADS